VQFSPSSVGPDSGTFKIDNNSDNASPTKDVPLMGNGILIGGIQVQIPDTQGDSATSVSIPIVVGDVTGREVISYQATITFDPLVVEHTGCWNSGTISEDWGPPFCAEPTPGEVNVGGFGTAALSGSGDLVMLEFDVVGSPCDSTLLHFQSFLFNAGDPVADPLLDGTFTVTPCGGGILTVTPDMWDYGDVPVGGSSDKVFELRNDGTVAFDVTGLSVVDGYFSLVSPPSTPFTLAPSATQNVTVQFSPSSVGPDSGTFKIDNNSDNASPTKDVPLMGNGVGEPQDSLIVLDGHGAPGSTGNLVEISLVNTIPVAGMQFTLCDIPNWLTATGGNSTPRTPGFTVSVADNDTCVMVLLFNTSGDSILADSDPVLQLVYDVDGGAPVGSTITMDIHDVIVSDPHANPIAVEEKDGVFVLGLKGDLNGDGKINILDIIRKVNIILRNPPPPTEYELWAADDNCDGSVNILDIILEVRCILYGECDFCSGKLAKISTQPARIGIDQVAYTVPDQLTVPIGIETPVPVAGVQLTLNYDSDKLVPGEVQTTELTDGFTVASRAESGRLTLLLYSTTGQLIPAGSGPVVQIPFKLCSEKAGGGRLHFEEAILAGENGGAIPVITKDALLPAAVPKSYGLSQNYPNPFNPETNIGYQLPEEGWVTLKVYNIEGQLVRTLVEGQREAGRYEVKWDRCDGFGKSVSSGIYFYRLKAGEFTQTRRMILIK